LNFLVIYKDQGSSDDKEKVTIIYDHLVAVQEDEKEQ